VVCDERRGLVLVHGGLCRSACWDPVGAHLTMPFVAVDLPGPGSRPVDLPVVTLNDCVQTTIDSAGQAGLERFVYVGHLLCGVTVTETASRRTGRVAQLIYVGAVVPAPGAGVAPPSTASATSSRWLANAETPSCRGTMPTQWKPTPTVRPGGVFKSSPIDKANAWKAEA
jgi:pimeloyl-ACP methyl ester carboxylesterase